MKSKLLLLTLLSFPAAHAQGPLTPPGPPAPVMRTLEQVEPRMPIPAQTATYLINQSGNYVLTGDITVGAVDGIRIEANDVTLDLGGFTISSTSPTGGASRGIYVLGKNIIIRNGRIKSGYTNTAGVLGGGGFAAAVEGDFSDPQKGKNVTVENLQISGCQYGIAFYWPDGTYAVRNCTVRDGISGILIGPIAGSFGEGHVTGCTVQQMTSTGIKAMLVTNCQIMANGTSAPVALNAYIANGCVATGGSVTTTYRYNMP